MWDEATAGYTNGGTFGLLVATTLPTAVAAVATHLVDVKGTDFAKDTDSLVNLAHSGEFDATLQDILDALAGIASIPEYAYTYTVTDGSGNPVQNVKCIVTSDAAGNVWQWTGFTNVSGQATLHSAVAGTNYIWVSHRKYSFRDNPDTATFA